MTYFQLLDTTSIFLNNVFNVIMEIEFHYYCLHIDITKIIS